MLEIWEEMAEMPDRDTLTEILKRRRYFQRSFRRHLWTSKPRRRRQMRRIIAYYRKKGLERVADGFVDEALLPPF